MELDAWLEATERVVAAQSASQRSYGDDCDYDDRSDCDDDDCDVEMMIKAQPSLATYHTSEPPA